MAISTRSSKAVKTETKMDGLVDDTAPDSAGDATLVEDTQKRKRDGCDEIEKEERPLKAHKSHTKHETYWALDGNLLLQFGDVRFKVHRSRLVAESKYFEALINTGLGNPDPDYEYQKEMEYLVSVKEVVDDLDCYHFNQDEAPFDCPTPNAFAALLDAMNRAIDWIYDPPSFETVKLVLSASVTFCMPRYYDFCTRFIKNLFPSNPRQVAESVSQLAVDGVQLGHLYLLLKGTLPAAYHELARAPLDSNKDLGQLTAPQLRTLLNVQKHLVEAWDNVASSLEVNCSKLQQSKTTDCMKIHTLPLKHLLSAKKVHPFDPILGIRYLRRMDWHERKYCAIAIEQVKKQLDQQANVIWTNLPSWVEEVEDAMD